MEKTWLERCLISPLETESFWKAYQNSSLKMWPVNFSGFWWLCVITARKRWTLQVLPWCKTSSSQEWWKLPLPLPKCRCKFVPSGENINRAPSCTYHCYSNRLRLSTNTCANPFYSERVTQVETRILSFSHRSTFGSSWESDLVLWIQSACQKKTWCRVGFCRLPLLLVLFHQKKTKIRTER